MDLLELGTYVAYEQRIRWKDKGVVCELVAEHTPAPAPYAGGTCGVGREGGWAQP